MSAHQLTKRFDGLTAVDGVSLDLQDGEMVAVIGPNGAGKTTLFNLFAGALQPDEGTLAIAGAAVTGEGAEARTARGVARTFQIPKPFAEMTVLENVLVAAQGQTGETITGALFRFSGVARQERAIRSRAGELLSFLNLTRLADEPARNLSGGQRKLLELARALMSEPKILLLDEPAAGVNPALMDFIMARIEEINGDGVAVLLIEHNMGVVKRLASRVVVMSSGAILAEGLPNTVLADPQVVAAYLGGADEAA
ncbi:MAG: ABC transporter ATP-binding protein [Pseudomonadota bacterium]